LNRLKLEEAILKASKFDQTASVLLGSPLKAFQTLFSIPNNPINLSLFPVPSIKIRQKSAPLRLNDVFTGHNSLDANREYLHVRHAPKAS
jgi:hypothetical protein